MEYEILDSGARFIQEIQKENNYQFEFTVTLSPDTSDVKIVHKLTNCGSEDMSFALWVITSMSSGGIEIIPRDSSEDVFTPNCIIALWPNSKLPDSRLLIEKNTLF